MVLRRISAPVRSRSVKARHQPVDAAGFAAAAAAAASSSAASSSAAWRAGVVEAFGGGPAGSQHADRLLCGRYGPHGSEVLSVRLAEGPVPPPRGATPADEEEPGWADGVLPMGADGVPFGRGGAPRLTLRKATGDPNVPAGELSVVADLSDHGLLPSLRDAEAAGYGVPVYLDRWRMGGAEASFGLWDPSSETVVARLRAAGQVNVDPERWEPEWKRAELLLFGRAGEEGVDPGRVVVVWLSDIDDGATSMHAIELLRDDAVPSFAATQAAMAAAWGGGGDEAAADEAYAPGDATAARRLVAAWAAPGCFPTDWRDGLVPRPRRIAMHPLEGWTLGPAALPEWVRGADWRPTPAGWMWMWSRGGCSGLPPLGQDAQADVPASLDDDLGVRAAFGFRVAGSVPDWSSLLRLPSGLREPFNLGDAALDAAVQRGERPTSVARLAVAMLRDAMLWAGLGAEESDSDG